MSDIKYQFQVQGSPERWVSWSIDIYEGTSLTELEPAVRQMMQTMRDALKENGWEVTPLRRTSTVEEEVVSDRK